MTLDMPRSDLSGWLLIATTAVRDPVFRKSVILVCGHSASGAHGLVLNRRASDMTLRRLYKDAGIQPVGLPVGIPIFAGGPEDIDGVRVVHNETALEQETAEVAENIRVTPHLARVSQYAQPHSGVRFLIALGQCTWHAGRLERELAEGKWLLAPARQDVIFTTPPDERWEAAMAAIRVPPARLSLVHGHA